MAISDLTKMWEDGDTADFSINDATAQQVFRCPWDDRTTSRKELLNSVHSDYSGMKCFSVRVEPLGDPETTAGGPNQAKLTAQYKPRSRVDSENPSGDAEAAASDGGGWIESWEYGVEAITLGGSGWVWADNGKSIKEDDVSAVKLFPVAHINVDGVWTSTPDKTAIGGLLGKVNDNTWRGFETETLLFVGLSVQESTNAEDSDNYRIGYSFSWKPDGWNLFYRKKDNPPQFIGVHQKLNSAVTPYDSANFDNLSPENW